MDFGQITQSLGGLLGGDDKAEQAAGDAKSAAGAAAGGTAAAGGAAAGGMGGIVAAILKLINNKGGQGTNGLQAMMGKFGESGLGDKVQSWLNPGDNERVSPDELKNTMGDDVDEVAREAGVGRDEAAEKMSQALPQVVDKLTPDGQVPSEGDLSSIIGKVLGRK